jgi:phytanoyl-CoA hydroxylase
MFAISTPSGEEISIPASIEEDNPYFTLDQVEEAVAYYNAQGYVVIRNCVPEDLCKQSQAAFANDIKSYKGHLYRQTGGNPERNRFNDRSFVMNPILNVQDDPTARLGRFRDATLSAICCDGARKFLTALFGGEAPKLMQTMYFEGNSKTWPHQDTYYLDSENIGSMAAGWYALEDIQPGAGRFFIYPKSHLIDLRKNGGDFDVAFNHDRYKSLVVDIIRKHGLVCTAPALRCGDVLFWHARTIHGSLESRQPDFSRSSLTAHFIPATHRYLQFQSRIKKTRMRDFKGWQVNHPKSLDTLRARAIMAFETSFPQSFQFLKWSAVKIFVTR